MSYKRVFGAKKSQREKTPRLKCRDVVFYYRIIAWRVVFSTFRLSARILDILSNQFKIVFENLFSLVLYQTNVSFKWVTRS